MKEEVWKDIEGYEGYYQISNMGRVKSLERTVWNKGRGCYITVSEKIRKGRDNGHGYLQVSLCKEGKVRYPLVHVLVATAFLENIDNLPEVNHKDENKYNNCVENLEYCSKLYNINYGTGIKRRAKKQKGRKQTEEHIKKRVEKLSKPVFSVDKESGLIMYWESIIEAERCTSIDSSSITKCCQGKRKSAGNHYWFYADDDE